MKFMIMIAMLFSFSAMAAWNEVECDGRLQGKSFRVEVEQSFPNGSVFKRAVLTVTEDGAERVEHFTVSSRPSGAFYRAEYSGMGLRLEVDFWPDSRPRWGMMYRGTLLSRSLGNQYIQGLTCRFPTF